MNTGDALYAILGNNCPQQVETVDGIEWTYHEIELHCLIVQVWCRFVGGRVIVRSIGFKEN